VLKPPVRSPARLAFLVAPHGCAKAHMGFPCGLSPPAIYKVPQVYLRLHPTGTRGQGDGKGLEDSQYLEQHYNQDNRHYKANYSTYSLHALTSPLTDTESQPPVAGAGLELTVSGTVRSKHAMD
jgi:hypothetical protein